MPDNCLKFLRCDRNEFVEFTCGPGTSWDFERKLCDVQAECYSVSYPIEVWNGNEPYPDISANYTYDSSLTPIVYSLDPVNGTAGDLLTINGSNFGMDPANVFVHIGSELSCLVVDVTETQVRCQLPNSSAGLISVVVTVYDRGCSNGMPFRYIFNVTGTSISQGGYGGGNNLTITGYGFSNNTRVFICDRECNITDYSSDNIVCTVPASPIDTIDVSSFVNRFYSRFFIQYTGLELCLNQ